MTNALLYFLIKYIIIIFTYNKIYLYHNLKYTNSKISFSNSFVSIYILFIISYIKKFYALSSEIVSLYLSKAFLFSLEFKNS